MFLQKTTQLLAIAVFAFVTSTPLAAAGIAIEADTYSCSVILGDGSSENNTCKFICDAGSIITVSATGSGGGGVSLSGACGGASAGCSADNGVTCSDASEPAAAGGEGSCSISPDNPGGNPDAGTGSCSASAGGGGGGGNECDGIYVHDICIGTESPCLDFECKDVLRPVRDLLDCTGDCPTNLPDVPEVPDPDLPGVPEIPRLLVLELIRKYVGDEISPGVHIDLGEYFTP